MMRSYLYLFSLLFVFLACGSDDEMIPRVEPPDPEPEEVDGLTYLALGDSYTIGTSVSIDDRFPTQLTTRLQADEVEILDPVYIAKVGWTTTALKNAIIQEALTDTFDLVSLLIGVNNQYADLDTSIFITEFPELLQTAIDYAGGDKNKVFVLSIPDYSYTPFGQNRPNPDQTSEELVRYNQIAKTITEAENIRFYNITPISQDGLTEPELVAVDGLHPSGEQYSRWIDIFYDDIKLILE